MAKWNPTYEVNLLEVLNEAYDSEELKEKLRDFVGDVEFKQLFGQRVVDEIVARTSEQNIDKHGRSMGSYSTSYKKSLIFQIYKSETQPVDLKLTGEMLASLNAKFSKYKIIVELEGDENKGKAEGHISGRLGKKGRAKPRDFLGLPKTELNNIFKQSMKDFRRGAIAEVALTDRDGSAEDALTSRSQTRISKTGKVDNG